ncbi:hypothetical protein BDU57DRAFT_24862 [Ampelomyces quisqualis]|uniref:Uncharacterized protein n=1 Tax=Ampelomyces quisqualis TaxID=50730 RepID=A0A6A5R485_AMPQU|nr:hypothetical protein BDU57DRAFT_24862 [Ampelomyces quisqualis]
MYFHRWPCCITTCTTGSAVDFPSRGQLPQRPSLRSWPRDGKSTADPVVDSIIRPSVRFRLWLACAFREILKLKTHLLAYRRCAYTCNGSEKRQPQRQH